MQRKKTRKPEEPDGTHTGLSWAAALLASSASRSQSKSLGSRDRGETAFIPGPHSGKRGKGSLGLWGSSLSPPGFAMHSPSSHMCSEWPPPRGLISQRKCASCGYKLMPSRDGVPQTPSDHPSGRLSPGARLCPGFPCADAKY